MIRFFQSKASRRESLKKAPFPSEWLGFLEQHVPSYRLLPPEDQRELQSHILVFLAEKSFWGANGFKVTDEVRVTIAAQACLLLLHRNTDYFPHMDRVVVYPSAFVAFEHEELGEGMEIVTSEPRLGESSQDTAEVVLSWDSVLRTSGEEDGLNVVLHEFAHQLDAENGAEDGAPELATPKDYERWARVMTENYEALVKAAGKGDKTLIDPYGASDPPEFFAVTVETFFEMPEALKKHHPDLYRELCAYFRQNPAALIEEEQRGAKDS